GGQAPARCRPGPAGGGVERAGPPGDSTPGPAPREGGVPMTDAALPIDVRTRYDRFPATIKGTFVLRGADGMPHRVLFESAALERMPTGSARPRGAGASIVDVPPGRDLFVPFEVSIVDLEPSWYAVR